VFLQEKEARRSLEESKQRAKVLTENPQVNQMEITRVNGTRPQVQERPTISTSEHSCHSGSRAGSCCDSHCDSHSGTHCGGLLVSSLRNNDGRATRGGGRSDPSCRSGTVVRFVDTVSEPGVRDVDSCDACSSSAVEEVCLPVNKICNGDMTGNEIGYDLAGQGELFPASPARTSRSRLKQRLKVDSFGRLYVPGWRKNSATERRVFDAIDRAFSSLTTFGRVYSMTRPCGCSNTRSSMTVEAATQSETLLQPSSMRRQRSCPPCGRTRRDSQMGTPHRTPSLDIMSLGRGQAEHSTDGDKLCQDSDRSCSNDTVSSGQSKLQRRGSACSRIPRLDKAPARKQESRKPADVKNKNRKSVPSISNLGKLVTIDKWDDFVNDMFNLHSCVLMIGDDKGE